MTSPLSEGDPKIGAQSPLASTGFRLVERLLLILIAGLTLAAAGIELVRVYEARSVSLADILLMFLYLEVIGMIAVFYRGNGSPFVYPIFIAMTALARLIVLQGKDMAPENIVYEAGAILLLAVAAIIVVRAGKT
ncbi:MAG: phosphate-starvation-inducible PsiE family protein [Hyphomonadaceae bacterium]|nr:phosphate-starvation-inducible PsiE family protein [Hyphomonadaceae bacterium]